MVILASHEELGSSLGPHHILLCCSKTAICGPRSIEIQIIQPLLLVKTLAHHLILLTVLVILLFFLLFLGHPKKVFDFIILTLFIHKFKNKKVVLELLHDIFSLFNLFNEILLIFESHRNGLTQTEFLHQLLFDAL